jgi:hypothetical protein
MALDLHVDAWWWMQQRWMSGRVGCPNLATSALSRRLLGPRHSARVILFLWPLVRVCVMRCVRAAGVQ